MNSVSLRMLEEIDRSGLKGMSLEGIQERFSDEESVQIRIELMKKNGLLSSASEGSVMLTNSAKITWLKLL